MGKVQRVWKFRQGNRQLMEVWRWVQKVYTLAALHGFCCDLQLHAAVAPRYLCWSVGQVNRPETVLVTVLIF
jgi:hypothetical protein